MGRGSVRIAVPLGETRVEVLSFRAHAADVEGEERLQEVTRNLDVGVVGEDDGDVSGKVPAVGPSAPAREALFEHRQVRLGEALG